MLPNASLQPRLEAEAQRTLEGVGCKALFGSVPRDGMKYLQYRLPYNVPSFRLVERQIDAEHVQHVQPVRSRPQG